MQTWNVLIDDGLCTLFAMQFFCVLLMLYMDCGAGLKVFA